MANFPTHIGIGTLASGALATLTLAANVVGPESLIAVTVAGIVGSVLPDIDLKDSRPGRALFFGLAVFFAFVALFDGAGRYSIVELWIIAAAIFFFVLYVVHFIFNRISYHRGIFHSILAAAFFACVTAIAYHRLLGRNEGVSWLAGGFMFIGYIVHLVLDEIYSVDVMDTRIKASFGTALKLWDGKHLGHSALMAAALAGAFLLAPPMKLFLQGITAPSLWAGLRQQMLPHDKWFGRFTPGNAFSWGHSVAGRRAEPAVAPAATSPVTTGSLPLSTPEPTPVTASEPAAMPAPMPSAPPSDAGSSPVR